MSDSPDFNAGGVIPGPHDGPRIRARGVCPLDGYHLVETEPGPYGDGGWEHVVPAGEAMRMQAALARIAEAHAFEASTEAEQITKDHA